jgi:hypothetical protein
VSPLDAFDAVDLHATRRMKQSSCAGAVLVLMTLVACDAGSTAPADAHDAMSSDVEETSVDAAPLCPDDLPASCPSPIPSYKNDVAPIFAMHCTLCHSPTGIAANAPETTYADVFAQASPILDQVYQCGMPPAGYPTLTTPERLTLLSWLVCNAPDN